MRRGAIIRLPTHIAAYNHFSVDYYSSNHLENEYFYSHIFYEM